ncbi:MAG: TlyA family RNA methyltransferase, partial [Streptosporangiales bacterium]|nr:TlyA family RNA methyltransferase [Streptosporangiales bacterium]
RRALDAGASTGGFTEVLLRAGAASVAAVDVGHDQLVPSLRADPRVRLMEGVNARDLSADAIGGPVDVVVADLSFISLRLVLPALARCGHEHTDLVVLVKPQFEVGRDAVGSTGVVRSPALRASAVQGVVDAAHDLGLGARGLVPGAVPGSHGNVEYVLWLRPGPDAVPPDVVTAATCGGSRSARA